jgi:hypothetical protein
MQMMDLTPFFRNVERIATALETIARNTGPVITSEPVDRLLRLDLTGTAGRTRPKEVKIDPRIRQTGVFREPIPTVDRKALPKDVVESANDQLIAYIKRIHDEGTHTANGIANSLKARGIPHPRGLKWHNLSVKPFMDELGLVSPFSGRSPRTQKSVEATTPNEPAPEPDPAPTPSPVWEKPIRRFVEREFQKPKPSDQHMSMRGPPSEKAQADERALIDEAIAAGRVTKLPAYTDSEGFNHLQGAQS